MRWLEPGDVLFHGTSSEEPFEADQETPDGPAWFTESEAVAQRFTDWSGGPRPRILAYRVLAKPRLLLWETDADIGKVIDEDYISEYDNRELAEAVCDAGYDGWTCPNNYPEGGADIMLCAPEDWLELVGLQDEEEANPDDLGLVEVDELGVRFAGGGSMTIPDFLESQESAAAWALENVDVDVGAAKTLDDLYELLDDPADPDEDYHLFEQQADAERIIDAAADYSAFAREVYSRGEPITGYRAVRVVGATTVRLDRLGKYWSRFRSGAQVLGRVPDLEAKTDVILTGLILPDDVDWAHGFVSYCYYGSDQWEVPALADAPITVLAVDDVLQEPPVLGNTGPFEHDTGWEPNAREAA
jgi:hypothetical protein